MKQSEILVLCASSDCKKGILCHNYERGELGMICSLKIVNIIKLLTGPTKAVCVLKTNLCWFDVYTLCLKNVTLFSFVKSWLNIIQFL